MSFVEVSVEKQAYEPGETVAGRVAWNGNVGGNDDKLLVSLLWLTAGKGTEDTEVVHQTTIENPGRQGERELSFELPDFPWSFSGKLISLTWMIEASLEPDGGVHQVEIVAAPGGAEIRL